MPTEYDALCRYCGISMESQMIPTHEPHCTANPANIEASFEVLEKIIDDLLDNAKDYEKTRQLIKSLILEIKYDMAKRIKVLS